MADDFMMKALYGANSIHIPMWMKVQDMGKDGVLFVGGSRRQDLRYKSEMTHQLIVGEMIVRPHYVVESNQFRGYGASGLVRDGGDIEDWLKHGNVILNPLSLLPKR